MKDTLDLNGIMTLRLTNDIITQIPLLGEWIETLGEKFNLPADKVFQLNLALEEAVVNVMNYAYPGQEDMPIIITANDEAGSLRFVIDDEGIAFDPTKAEEPDLTLSAEERPIGGLGIMLVKQLSKSVDYQRIDNHNLLTIIF